MTKHKQPAHAGCFLQNIRQRRNRTAAAAWLILYSENVCHEAAVGSSAESSTASAFSTFPVLYNDYTTQEIRFMKNP